jgi:protein O-mannosyl-transferase
LLDRWNERLRQSSVAVSSLLLLITFAAYAGTLKNGFVYDDGHQIIENPYVLNSHFWLRIFTGSVWSFQGVAVQTNFYRPLQFFTYFVLYHIAGLNPAAFHLYQVFLYAATVWLMYRIGCRLLRSEVAAFVAAGLWALHPLHVEAIAWIASMPETGFGFFYLLGFLLFLRAEGGDTHQGWKHALAAAAYFPALFFKEMALSLPILLVAYWVLYAPRGSWPRRGLHLLPYLVGISLYVEVRRMMLGHFSYAHGLFEVSLKVIGAAVGLLGAHTRLFFWPTHLNDFRVFEVETGLHSPWPWLTLLGLILTLWYWRRDRLFAFLIFWWPVALLPCLDIRQLSFPLLAERFSYIPSAGLCMALSYLLFVKLPVWLPRINFLRVAAPVVGIVTFFWAFQTVRAVPNWHDNATLAEYSLKQSPDAALLHIVRGLVLEYQKNDFNGAITEYHTALELNRTSLRPLASVTYDAYIGLGQIALIQGHTDVAIQHFERAVLALPGYSPAYDSLGSVYFPRREYAKAAGYFAQAVKVNPQDLGGLYYLGACYVQMGKFREAAGEFHAARVIDPTFVQAYESEAQALDAAGDHDAASKVRQLAGKS